MPEGHHPHIAEKIYSDLDMEYTESPDDETMILHIADRVDQLLKADPDLLMSYLYRLDVEEKHIAHALKTSKSPAFVTLARLIWDRQKQRIETKHKYKQDPIEGWETF